MREAVYVRTVAPYLAAKVLTQARPAGRALVDDRMSAAKHGDTFSGKILVVGVDDKATHF